MDKGSQIESSPRKDLEIPGRCTSVQGKTWKGASPDALAQVRELLLRRGAIEDKDLNNPHEAWRVRIEKSVFTGYRSGTIYCNGGTIPELPFLYKSIANVLDAS